MKQIIKEKLLLRLFIMCLIASATSAQGISQNVERPVKPEIAAQANPTNSKNAWQLRINKGAVPLIDLSASDAPLADLAADLSDQLGVPVKLSPVMQKQLVTSKLQEVSIEMAARSLAPIAYIDEAINFPSDSDRQLLGVYLSGINEAPQPSSNKLKTSDQADMVFGNTEGGVPESSSKDNSLFIKAENGRISIRAKRQSVTIILFEIAQRLGIAFELQQDIDRLVDIDLQDYRLEEALRELPASIRLLRQINLSNGESQPYRVILLGSQG